MEERIVGQSHALDAIAQRIRTSRANLTDPRRPIGVFLLVGPSGVGKTETAITLAELLYGGDQNMTVINMSEFKEEHKVSLLMGSPAGLRRLRRRRRADRGRPPPSVQRGAAWTRWKRPIPACRIFSIRSSTRARSATAKAATSTSRTRSS